MPTLKSLVDETTNIKNEIVNCYDNLKNNLIDNNINILDSDKLSDLINKTKEISNVLISLYSSLPSIGREGELAIITPHVDANIYISKNDIPISDLNENDIFIKDYSEGESVLNKPLQLLNSNSNVLYGILFKDVYQKINNEYVKLDTWSYYENGEWHQLQEREIIYVDKDVIKLASTYYENGTSSTVDLGKTNSISITVPKKTSNYIFSNTSKFNFNKIEKISYSITVSEPSLDIMEDHKFYIYDNTTKNAIAKVLLGNSSGTYTGTIDTSNIFGEYSFAFSSTNTHNYYEYASTFTLNYIKGKSCSI